MGGKRIFITVLGTNITRKHIVTKPTRMTDTIAESRRSQTDEQRQEYGHQHPTENQQQLGSLSYEVVGRECRYKSDGYQEKSGSAEQGEEALAVDETLGLEALDALHQKIHHQPAQQRGETDEESHQKEESEHDGTAPLAPYPGVAVETAAVFGTQLVQGLLDILPGMAEDLEIILLSLGEYPLLDDAIALLGIVIRFLEADIGTFVMLAVCKDLLLPFLVKVEDRFGIEDTGIAVILAGLVEQERLLARYGIETVYPFLYHGSAAHQAVAVQRVRQHGDVPGRRQPPQRLQQPLIPVYLGIQSSYYLVIGHPAGVEQLILTGHLLQGICHVEGIVLVLRIQHERQLVVFLDHIDHLLMLGLVQGLHLRPGGAQPVILLLELVTENGQSVAQVLLVENG